jgi:hypothetical protein
MIRNSHPEQCERKDWLIRVRDVALVVRGQERADLVIPPVEAHNPVAMSFGDRQTVVRDGPKHRLAGNHDQVSGLRTGHVDVRSHAAAFGYEARPEHRLDQQERERGRRSLARGHAELLRVQVVECTHGAMIAKKAQCTLLGSSRRQPSFGDRGR